MIAGELRRFLRDHSAVRVSRSMRDTAYRVLQAKEKLTAETGREPDVEQIAKSLNIPRQEVVFALEAITDPVSLYDPIYSDGGETATVMDKMLVELCNQSIRISTVNGTSLLDSLSS